MKRFFYKLWRLCIHSESWDIADYRYYMNELDRATKALQRSEGLPARGMRISIDRMIDDYAQERKKKK